MFKSRDNRSGVAPEKNSGSSETAVNVDLRKLRRLDLLELLVDQIRENEQNEKTIEELSDLAERLKAKLNEKDDQIERLKSRLNDKDAKIAALERHLGIAPSSFVVFNPDVKAANPAQIIAEESEKLASAVQTFKPASENSAVPAIKPVEASQHMHVPNEHHASDSPEPEAEPLPAVEEPSVDSSNSSNRPEKKSESNEGKGFFGSLPFLGKAKNKTRSASDAPKLEESSSNGVEVSTSSSLTEPSTGLPNESMKPELSSLPAIEKPELDDASIPTV